MGLEQRRPRRGHWRVGGIGSEPKSTRPHGIYVRQPALGARAHRPAPSAGAGKRIDTPWERERLARTGAPAPGTTPAPTGADKRDVRIASWSHRRGERDARAPRKVRGRHEALM